MTYQPHQPPPWNPPAPQYPPTAPPPAYPAPPFPATDGGTYFGAPGTQPTYSPYPGDYGPEPPRKSKTPIVMGVVVVLLVVALVAVGVVLATRSDEDPKDTANTGERTGVGPQTDEPGPSTSPSRPKRSGKLIAPAGAPFQFRQPPHTIELDTIPADFDPSLVRYFIALAPVTDQVSSFVAVYEADLQVGSTVTDIKQSFDVGFGTPGQDVEVDRHPAVLYDDVAKYPDHRFVMIPSDPGEVIMLYGKWTAETEDVVTSAAESIVDSMDIT